MIFITMDLPRSKLEIIFNLYLMVFGRINPDSGNFTAHQLNPTPLEIGAGFITRSLHSGRQKSLR